MRRTLCIAMLCLVLASPAAAMVDLEIVAERTPIDISLDGDPCCTFGPVNVPNGSKFGPMHVPEGKFGPVHVPNGIGFGPVRVPNGINFGSGTE